MLVLKVRASALHIRGQITIDQQRRGQGGLAGRHPHPVTVLICELALDIADCERRFGIDFRAHFADELATLAPLEADGLLTLGEEEIRIHEAGRPFLRNICMPFDEYLEVQQREQGRRFSATV